MKKIFLIAFFALVTLQLKAQKPYCVNVDRIELKTWSETFQKHVVTESFNVRGACSTCIVDNMISFTLNKNEVTYYIMSLEKEETEDGLQHSVYKLSNGGHLLLTYQLEAPHYMIITTMLDGGKVTTYYVNEM